MKKPIFSKLGAIYKIENSLNGKVYIGQSIEVHRRWYKHKDALRKNAHRSNHLQKAWNFYSDETIWVFSIIDLCNPDKEIMRQREQYWMDLFQSFDENHGYNMSPAACSLRGFTFNLSPETRKKISEIRKGKKMGPRSEEYRRKLSEAQKGKTKTPEHCKAISEAKKGKKMGPRSEAHRKALSDKMKGRTFTEEWRKKISAALTGKKRGPHSEAHRKALSDAAKKRSPRKKRQEDT